VRGLAAAVLAVLLGLAAPARADVQQWTELGVDKSLGERWSLTFEQQLRFDLDQSRVDAVMPELGLHRRLARWLRIGTGYRFQYQRDNAGDMVFRHRFHVYGRARRDLGDVRLDYRLQVQETVRPTSNDVSRHALRNRGDVSYRGFKRWEPGVAGELFHAIDDGDPIHLDKIWLTAGVAYTRKAWSVDVFYRAELPVADTMDPTIHILGLGMRREL